MTEDVICSRVREAIKDEKRGAEDYDELARLMLESRDAPASLIVRSIANVERGHAETLEKVSMALRCKAYE